jgi:membrane-associated phospholipid phosphatase
MVLHTQISNLANDFRRQGAWYVLWGTLFISASVFLFDRPIAWLVAHPPGGIWHETSLLRHAVNLHLDALLILLPVSLFMIVRVAIVRCGDAGLSRSSSALALAGAATAMAVSVSDLLLKPFFGRYTLEDLPQHFGFRLFAGNMESSFPSGHATFTTAFFWVLIVLYPERRAAWTSILVVTFFGLIFAQWHFLSDVIAGALLGSFAGMGVIALAARRGPKELELRMPRVSAMAAPANLPPEITDAADAERVPF